MRVNALWLAVVLLAGLLLGGWGPRLDLKKAREELKSLKDGQAKTTGRSAELAGLQAMLRLPEGERRPRRPPRPAPEPATQSVARVAETTNPPLQRLDRQAEMRKASELWLTRVAMARSAFVSNVQLDKEQEKSFDVLIEAMNLRLGAGVDKWVDALRAKGTLQPEDGLRIVNDLSGVLVLTYDEMDRTMPADWRQKAGENFQLVNLIDPDAVMPLMELDDIAMKRPRSGPPWRRPRGGTP